MTPLGLIQIALNGSLVDYHPTALNGRIYGDLPYDEADPAYQILAAHLENPDGSMKIEGVTFYYMPLDEEIKYTEQDEPRYWENE